MGKDTFNVDQALNLLGTLGKWHIFSYFLISIIYATAGFHMLAIVFFGKYR